MMDWLRHKAWMWAIAIVAVSLSAIAWWKGAAISKWWRLQQGYELIQKAETLLAKGDKATAVHLLVESLPSYADQADYVRFLGVELVKEAHDGGRTLLEVLDRRQETTDQDLGYLAIARLQAGDTAGAMKIKNRMHDASVIPWKLWAQTAERMGLSSEAAEGYRMANSAEPGAVEVLAGLPRIGSASERRASVGDLLKMAELHSSEAIDALLGLWMLSAGEEKPLLAALQELRQPTLKQELALIYLKQTDAAARRPEWASVLARTAASLDEVADGLRFVQALGDHQLVIEQTEQPLREASEACGAVRVDSFLHLGKWAEALAVADRATSPLPRPTRDLVKVLIGINARQWDGMRLRKELWSVFLLSKSLGRTGAYQVVGNLAMENEMPDLAADVLGEAFIEAPGSAISLDEWLLAARRAGWGLANVRQTLEWKLGRDGGHLDARKRLLYINLLEGTHLETGAKEAQELASALRQDGLARLVAALGAFRMGDPRSVESALLPLPSWRWHQGEAAVIRQLLIFCGKPKLAVALHVSSGVLGVWPEESDLHRSKAKLEVALTSSASR